MEVVVKRWSLHKLLNYILDHSNPQISRINEPLILFIHIPSWGSIYSWMYSEILITTNKKESCTSYWAAISLTSYLKLFQLKWPIKFTMIFILLGDNLQELMAFLKCIRLGPRLSSLWHSLLYNCYKYKI